MRFQPNRDYVSNDDIQTPPELAAALIQHLMPRGLILEPCCGDGHFLGALPPDTEWCEIKRGRDFFEWSAPVDWIITNPPWSRLRKFLQHSFSKADHVAFLMTINHAWTKARLRDMRQAGFGIREIIEVPMPRSFPQSGFALGMVHYERGWNGPMDLLQLG